MSFWLCYLVGVATKVFVIDVAREEVIDGPINIRGLLSQSVKEYKQTVGKVINMDPKQMKVILPKYPDSYDLVESDDNDLQTEGFYNAKKIFVLTMNDTDNNKPLQESTVYKIIKNFKYVISLYIQLPDISKGKTLMRMYFLQGLHDTMIITKLWIFLCCNFYRSVRRIEHPAIGG